jgi:hypothetical protein
MRLLLLACSVMAFASACLGGSAQSTQPTSASPGVSEATPTTRLAIAYSRDSYQGGKIVVLHERPLALTCQPASGDVTDPVAACRALLADPSKFVGRSTATCFGPVERWSVKITGTLAGRPVTRTFDMCDYPQARAWTDLGGTTLIGVVPAGSPEAKAGPQNRPVQGVLGS